MTHEDIFQSCIRSILKHEGGLSNNKKDPGGITQYGISLRYLRSIGYDINGDGKVDEEDIIALTFTTAIDIYRKHWWDKYRYATFNELVVVEKVFDMAINMGASQAHKLLQKSINRFSPFNIKVDGILGGITLGAANQVNSIELRQFMREEAEIFYKDLVKKNPDFKVFKNGWLRRAKW